MSESSSVAIRSARTRLVPLMAAFLVACSGGTDQGAAPAPAAPATADACDLLSPEEAEQIVGGVVDEPKGGAPVSSDTVRLTDCTWMEMKSGRTVTILLRRAEGADASSAAAVASVRAELAAVGPVDDVKGLADIAFWGSNQLHAFRGGRDYVMVSVAGFPEDEAASAARKAAEIALGRL